MIPPRRPWSGWLDGGHLTLDVVVALVDGELAEGPTQRALAHVDHCLSCAAEVTAQRQARRRLRDAAMPGAPTSLLSSLRAIPDCAELPAVPGTLGVDAQGRFVVRADPARGDDARVEPADGTVASLSAHAPPAGTASTDATATTDAVAADAEAAEAAEAAAGPQRSRLSRRARRRLAVGLPAAVVSGLAVGAVSLGAPAAAPTAPAASPRPVVVPRGDATAAQLSLRGDQGPGLPGPGDR